MSAYLRFISNSLQKHLAYRLEYFISILNAFLFIFIFTSVWSVLLADGRVMSGLDRDTMVAYAVLTTLIKSSFGRSEGLISSKVRSGEILMDLIKPFSFLGFVLCDTLGSTLFQLLAKSLPLLAFSFLFFDIRLPVGPETLALFALMYATSFAIHFLMTYNISMLAFYFTDIFAFWLLYYALLTLLSGAVVPNAFLPAAIRDFADYTPFPYLFYYPTMLILGKLEPARVATVWQAQLACVLGLFATGRFLWYRGVARLESHGG